MLSNLGGLIGNIIGNGGINIYSVVSVIISATIVVFITMPIHEYAHGFAAEKLGDPTPRAFGRMSLNPMNHIDWRGAALIYLLGIGWAKPVMVDGRYFKKPKLDMAIVAAAGPVANLLLAFVSMLLCNLTLFAMDFVNVSILLTVLYLVTLIFYNVAVINISLALFNLVPIPPLDGSKILAVLLPDRIYYKLMRYERYFTVILLVIIYLTSFSDALSNLVYGVTNLFFNITGLPFGLFTR